MNLIKDNFRTIFVVASMIIIGVGTLIYDVNSPSLSAPNNIIKIGDTLNTKVYETVNLNDLFDVDGVYTCSSDNEEVAQAVNCNIYAISGGSAKIKIEYKETEAGEVLDEKTITVNVSKLKMVVTNFPNELTMDINDTYKLLPNTNGVDVRAEYIYDESAFKIEENNGYYSLVALKEGTYTLKATFVPEMPDKYESATKTMNITVRNIIEPNITVNDITMYVGDTKEVEINTNDIIGSLKLTSDDESIISVEGMNIKGLKEGKTSVTVLFKPEDVTKYKEVTKKINVTVSKVTETSKVETIVNDLKEKVKNYEELDVSFNNNVLSLYTCKGNCETSSNKTIVDLNYNVKTGILSLVRPIKVFTSNNNTDIDDEYMALSILLSYLSDKGIKSINSLGSYIVETGKNDALLSMSTSGINLYYGSIDKVNVNDQKYYIPTVLNSFEYNVNSVINDAPILKISIKNSTGGVVNINKIENINGKDIVTLSSKSNAKYGFDSLVIKDSNGKDITKKVNFNKTNMTFEMPSNDVIIESTFINNVKTGVNDFTTLLAITMLIFGVGLYIVRKNVNSLEI
ncbi:MAG: hypothetical protein PUE43_05785 [Clostridium sp.]|nr:hypothetical protein [Clostridium sp.]